jgi:hypothetical protein
MQTLQDILNLVECVNSYYLYEPSQLFCPSRCCRLPSDFLSLSREPPLESKLGRSLEAIGPLKLIYRSINALFGPFFFPLYIVLADFRALHAVCKLYFYILYDPKGRGSLLYIAIPFFTINSTFWAKVFNMLGLSLSHTREPLDEDIRNYVGCLFNDLFHHHHHPQYTVPSFTQTLKRVTFTDFLITTTNLQLLSNPN